MGVEAYSIKQISNITGYKPHVIRFYEKEFDLDIPRDENNRRYFTRKEVDKLNYIKGLQQKGLSNKQIKQILISPESEEVFQEEITKQELSVSEDNVVKNIADYRESKNMLQEEEVQYLVQEVLSALNQLDYKKEINDLAFKFEELKAQLDNQDKDVLICENAKLKMKMKEKSYEVAELKEKLKREQNKQISLWSKLFGSK